MVIRPPPALRAASQPAGDTARRAPAPKARPVGRGTALHLDGQLCFALYATSLAMIKVYRPLLAPLGLTYPQYVVMLALWERGEPSAGALGERVSLDSGTLVALVRKLVAIGLVEHRRCATDDRSVLISLTIAGSDLRHRDHAVREQVACATQSTDAQRHALLQSLRALCSALTSGPPTPTPTPRSSPALSSAANADRPITTGPRAPMRPR